MSKRTIIISVVLLLVTGGIVYWNVHKRSIVRSTVKDAVADKTNKLDGFRTGGVDLVEVAGYV